MPIQDHSFLKPIAVRDHPKISSFIYERIYFQIKDRNLRYCSLFSPA